VKQDSGLPNVAVYDIAYDSTGYYFVAATHGRGMWRTSITTVVSEGAVVAGFLPRLRVFPNPAKDVFIVEPTVPLKGVSELIFYNITGRRVASVSGFQGAGPLRLSLSLAPGRYFIRLKNGEMEERGSVVIVK
jgi:hypothetical protein